MPRGCKTTNRAKDAYVRRNRRLVKHGIADSYREYLASELWQEIRGKVLARDNHTCRICGKTATQVHHTNYKRGTLEGRGLLALVSLCGGCHEFIEFLPDGTKANMTEMRKRMYLLAHLKGRTYTPPVADPANNERRYCPHCGRRKTLKMFDGDSPTCRRCCNRKP